MKNKERRRTHNFFFNFTHAKLVNKSFRNVANFEEREMVKVAYLMMSL